LVISPDFQSGFFSLFCATAPLHMENFIYLIRLIYTERGVLTGASAQFFFFFSTRFMFLQTEKVSGINKFVVEKYGNISNHTLDILIQLSQSLTIKQIIFCLKLLIIPPPETFRQSCVIHHLNPI
jgi:hypothetical protein